MIDDENLAQTWYVFWILPLIFIGLNLFMIPKYEGTLYTGRILQGYIVISLVLLIILMLFYTMFLMMANSLNKNARLQQENHFLSLQQARYENLCSAIEEARQARHDIRHHFLQLSSLAEKGDLEKIKEYLSNANSKIPDYNLQNTSGIQSSLIFGNHKQVQTYKNQWQHFSGSMCGLCLCKQPFQSSKCHCGRKTWTSRKMLPDFQIEIVRLL